MDEYASKLYFLATYHSIIALHVDIYLLINVEVRLLRFYLSHSYSI